MAPSRSETRRRISHKALLLNTKHNPFMCRSCSQYDFELGGRALRSSVREKLRMSIRMFAVALAATLCVAGTLPAVAADLDGDRYSAGPPDDDPRYGAIYGRPAPPPRRYAAPYPEAYYREPYPPYRRDDGYLRPMNPPYPPAYEERRWRSSDRYDGGCLPRHVIKDRLVRSGWHDFDDLELRGEVAHVRARRPDGYLFDLTVDRCDGRILEARMIGRREADAGRWRYRDRAPMY